MALIRRRYRRAFECRRHAAFALLPLSMRAERGRQAQERARLQMRRRMPRCAAA